MIRLFCWSDCLFRKHGNVPGGGIIGLGTGTIPVFCIFEKLANQVIRIIK